MTTEHDRLEETQKQKIPWKKWGPYLSERQWGTVREDYSDNGDAWNYLGVALFRRRSLDEFQMRRLPGTLGVARLGD